MKSAMYIPLVLVTVTVLLTESAQAAEQTKALEKLDEIRAGLKAATDKVREIAKADNPEVGKVISDKIDAGSIHVGEVFKKTKEAAKAGTLTQAMAKTNMNDFLSDLKKRRENIYLDIAKLSNGTRTKIEEMHKNYVSVLQASIEQLYKLL